MITDLNAAVRWFTYWIIVILVFWMLLGYIMLATGHHKGEEAWVDMNKRVCKVAPWPRFLVVFLSPGQK